MILKRRVRLIVALLVVALALGPLFAFLPFPRSYTAQDPYRLPTALKSRQRIFVLVLAFARGSDNGANRAIADCTRVFVRDARQQGVTLTAILTQQNLIDALVGVDGYKAEGHSGAASPVGSLLDVPVFHMHLHTPALYVPTFEALLAALERIGPLDREKDALVLVTHAKQAWRAHGDLKALAPGASVFLVPVAAGYSPPWPLRALGWAFRELYYAWPAEKLKQKLTPQGDKTGVPDTLLGRLE
jgi:hypothetical protein